MHRHEFSIINTKQSRQHMQNSFANCDSYMIGATSFAGLPISTTGTSVSQKYTNDAKKISNTNVSVRRVCISIV